MGMTSPATLYTKTLDNFPVILLLIFMVAGIFFMKEMLLYVFTRILLGVRAKWLLSLLFCAVAAVLSAYLDALTVTAVVITVAIGFYRIYHDVVSEFRDGKAVGSLNDDSQVPEDRMQEIRQFRSFLRGLMMHAAVGTALGGVTTLVGEPQNLLLAKGGRSGLRRRRLELRSILPDHGPGHDPGAGDGPFDLRGAGMDRLVRLRGPA